MNYNKTVYKTATALVMLAAIHLGLVGLFGFDLIGAVLGDFPQVERLTYILIGASGIYHMTTKKK